MYHFLPVPRWNLPFLTYHKDSGQGHRAKTSGTKANTHKKRLRSTCVNQSPIKICGKIASPLRQVEDNGPEPMTFWLPARFFIY
ncbi:MAG: hypothetical protein ACRC2T_17655 [Thermoguttaceae bacterium]